MKKRYLLAVTLMIALLFTACASEKANQIGNENRTSSFETSATTPVDEPTNATETESTNHSTSILVAYFSCTGNTKQLAEYVADELGADCYEIVPITPYTESDLNYNDPDSRSSTEMHDDTARPAISDSLEHMEEYTTVFLAYPIWFGDAPRIINTFLESYDFSGKTIVPFCTSGSSGMGSSDLNLHGLCSESAVWLSGERFAGGTSKETIVDWLKSLELEDAVQQ